MLRRRFFLFSFFDFPPPALLLIETHWQDLFCALPPLEFLEHSFFCGLDTAPPFSFNPPGFWPPRYQLCSWGKPWGLIFPLELFPPCCKLDLETFRDRIYVAGVWFLSPPPCPTLVYIPVLPFQHLALLSTHAFWRFRFRPPPPRCPSIGVFTPVFSSKTLFCVPSTWTFLPGSNPQAFFPARDSLSLLIDMFRPHSAPFPGRLPDLLPPSNHELRDPTGRTPPMAQGPTLRNLQATRFFCMVYAFCCLVLEERQTGGTQMCQFLYPLRFVRLLAGPPPHF